MLEQTQGVFIVAQTPFDDTGGVDLDSIDSLVDFYLRHGADGFTVLGVAGEASKLTPQEAGEVGALTQHALRALRHATGAQGFNVGMNLGVVGGAGIAAHLHQHVVPRWGGDTNFMPVVGQTKILPQLLPDTRALLAQAWSEV